MCVICEQAYKSTDGHTHSDHAGLHALGGAESINMQAETFGYKVSADASWTEISYADASQYTYGVLDGLSWSGTSGKAVSISYSFDYSGADSDIIYGSGQTNFTTAEQELARAAMAEMSQVIGVSFVETSTANAELHFYNATFSDAAGLAGYYYYSDDNGDGIAQLSSATVGMDVSTMERGTSGYETLLHEIGHALGLKHSHDTSAGGALPTNLDNNWNTVMTYNDGSPWAETLQEIDVAALQYLYGGTGYYDDSTTTGTTTGTNTNSTDSDDDAGDGTYIGSVVSDDLRGGLGSDTLYGGEGDDTMYGGRERADSDDLPDELYGQSGNDEMYGNAGGDTLYGDDRSEAGDDGNDTIYGGIGADSVYGGGGNDFLTGGGDVAHPEDNADLVDGGSGDDLILGNGGGDTVSGGTGNDTIWGGIDDDSIVGDAGNDLLIGQDGDDTLTGGDGADIFAFYDSNNADVIMDFDVSQDVIRLTSNINGSGITSADAALASFTQIDSDWSALVVDGASEHVVFFYQLSGDLTAANIDIVDSITFG